MIGSFNTQADNVAAIKQLPVKERAVVVALKSLFDQIRAIQAEESEEVKRVHEDFIGRFKDIQEQNSLIIMGHKTLSQADLGDHKKYFTPTEQAELQNHLDTPRPIKNYWDAALLNSEFSHMFSPVDHQLLSCVTELKSEVTVNCIKISISFGPNQGIVSPGTFVRKLFLEQGASARLEGDEPQISKEGQSFLKQCFLSNQKCTSIETAVDFMGYLVNNVLPYSLEYFLGSADPEEEQDNEDESAGESEPTPSKKVKESAVE